MKLRTALLAVALAGGCVFITDAATLTVHNHSSHTLVELRLAETSDWTWGSNLMTRTMHPGDDLTVEGISCGHYDVLVTDTHAASCMLSDVHLCGDDHDWVITDLCW